jgi:hypothetical protein
MINRAFLILTFIFITSCAAQTDNLSSESSSKKNNLKTNPDNACICMMIYEPVCHEGKTYGNACQAKCEGVKKFKPGACTP